MDKTEIKSFKGKYAFLNNSYPVKIQYEGMTFGSVERAFQASKSEDVQHRMNCQIAQTDADARFYGNRIPLKAVWEEKKVEIMRMLLAEKFNTPLLRQMLLETGNAQLINTVTYKDTFWGVYRSEGENLLGKLLVEVRDDLKTSFK